MNNVDFVRSLYEAIGRGDVPTLLAAMDPGIRWHEAEGNPYEPGGEALVGPDAVLNGVFAKLGGDFDAFGVHPRTFHDAGDVVVVEARYSGTSKKTGLRLDAQACHVWTLESGKLTKFQQYVDTAHLRKVMGA